MDEGPRVRVSAFDLQVAPGVEAAVDPAVMYQARQLLSAAVASQSAEGLTIGQMEAAAQEVTKVFRASGLVLALAYLPVQDVRSGQVRIDVLAGTLGEISAEGNQKYSSDWLSIPFRKLQGNPVVIEDLESAILSVRDYPGLSPAAVLSPGKVVGTSDLTLRVTERPVDFGLTGDNYGSITNGQYRARGWMALNNPLGHADRLYVDVLQAFDPTENTYGGISYWTRFDQPGVSLGLEYSQNAFDVDKDLRDQLTGNQPLNGESTIFSIPARIDLIRSRNLNLDLNLGLSIKRASYDDPLLRSQGVDPKREDKLSVASVGLDLSGADRIFGSSLGINNLTLRADIGMPGTFGSMDEAGDTPSGSCTCSCTRQGGSRDCAGGDFTKLSVSYQRLQQMFRANSLQFKGYYQYTDDLLVSLEQATLGGFNTVRAYTTSQQLVDRGGFASLEWLVDVHDLLPNRPQNWDLTVFLFGDYGQGQNNAPQPGSGERKTIKMAGWGGGTQFRYRMGERWALEARLDVSTPINEGKTDSVGFAVGDWEPLDPLDDDDPRVWGWVSLSYQ